MAPPATQQIAILNLLSSILDELLDCHLTRNDNPRLWR